MIDARKMNDGRRVLLLALALVFALGATACGSSDSPSDAAVAAPDSVVAALDDEPAKAATATEPAGAPAPAEPTAVDDAEAETDPTPVEAADTESDESTDVAWGELPGVWDSFHDSRASEIAHWMGDIEATIGEPLPARLEPGRYTTGQLGTSISFTTTAPFALIDENPGHVLLVDRPGDPRGLLYFLRPVGVFGAERTLDANAQIGGRGWADPVAEDLGEWLSTLVDVETSELAATTIGGRETSVYDLAPDESSGYFCEVGRCFNLLPAGTAIQGAVVLHGDEVARLWEIEEEGTDLLILAKAEAETSDEWFETVQLMLDSMELGPRETAASETVVWDPRGIIGPGEFRWAGVEWVTTGFDGQLGFFNVLGYLGFDSLAEDGSPSGSPGEGDLFADLVRAQSSRDGDAIESLDAFAELASAGFGVGTAEEIDTPQALIDRFGTMRSFRIAVPPQRGIPAQPLFHHSALPDVAPYTRGAFTSGGYDELHAFERDGDVWVVIYSSWGVDQLDEARVYGLEVLSKMTFDPPASAIGSVEAGTDLTPGLWRIDTFDTPVSFRLDVAGWVAAVNDENITLVQERAALEREEPVRWFALLEPTGIAAADELTELPDGPYSLPVSGFEDWLEAMTFDDGDGPRATTTSAETTVGSDPATVVDLELHPGRADTIEGGCGADRCYGFASLGAEALPLIVRPGESYRFWFVSGPHGDVVIAAAVASGDEAWLDGLDPIVESIAFG